jgi:alpha-L-fucosidase
VTAASLELDFGQEVEFNRFLAQEPIALGQRVKKFSLQIWQNGAYETIAQQTTIGYKRLLRFPTVKTSRLRFSIEAAKACPTINNLAVYHAPQ